MAGSGLQEVLGCVYASNTVGHMLSGKPLPELFVVTSWSVGH